MNFKMFQNGNVPQIAVRLILREKGNKPFDELPDRVEVIDEVTIAVTADSSGALVTFRGDIEGMAVVIPLRLSLLETAVTAACSVYKEKRKINGGFDSMRRSEFEDIIMEQTEEIKRLRDLVASRGEWKFEGNGSSSEGAS